MDRSAACTDSTTVPSLICQETLWLPFPQQGLLSTDTLASLPCPLPPPAGHGRPGQVHTNPSPSLTCSSVGVRQWACLLRLCTQALGRWSSTHSATGDFWAYILGWSLKCSRFNWRLQVLIFRFFSISLRRVPYIPLKWWVTWLKSSTDHFLTLNRFVCN